MASFPNAVKTFTTKQDGSGNVIFASHVNDLQDEVNAIEDGLRNGTAPLNSSNSTFTNLSVSGKSTFAGDVNFASTGVTFSGQLTAPNQPAWHLFSTTVVQIGAGSTTSISYESELFDQGGFHSTGANPDRVTVPTGSSGLYLMGFSVYMRGGPSAINLTVGFTRNSSREDTAPFVSPLGLDLKQTFTTMLRLDGGDVIRTEIQGPGSTASVGITSPATSGTRFWGAKLS